MGPFSKPQKVSIRHTPLRLFLLLTDFPWRWKFPTNPQDKRKPKPGFQILQPSSLGRVPRGQTTEKMSRVCGGNLEHHRGSYGLAFRFSFSFNNLATSASSLASPRNCSSSCSDDVVCPSEKSRVFCNTRDLYANPTPIAPKAVPIRTKDCKRKEIIKSAIKSTIASGGLYGSLLKMVEIIVIGTCIIPNVKRIRKSEPFVCL